MDVTRRSIARGAAWSVPVIAVAAAAPAFAGSQPIDCTPTAECKLQGNGHNTKDYVIRTNCTSPTPIACVEVWDDKRKRWVRASNNGDGTWTAYDFNDSRRDRLVRLTDARGQQKFYNVAFPPC